MLPRSFQLCWLNLSDEEDEDEELLLLALLAEEEHKSARDKQSLYRRRLSSGKIRRGALLPPSKSPFIHLWNSGQDDALRLSSRPQSQDWTGQPFLLLWYHLFHKNVKSGHEKQFFKLFPTLDDGL